MKAFSSHLVVSFALTLAACGASPEEGTAGRAAQAAKDVRLPDPARELLITDPSVVDDTRYTTYVDGNEDAAPEGAWTWGRLIDNLLPVAQRTPAARSQFVFRFLHTWESERVVNGFVVAPRPAIREMLIDPWKRASGCTGGDEECVLDMKQAPFRLLAIVYRPDLRRVPCTNGEMDRGSPGQGRFVFSSVDETGRGKSFYTIFEYELPGDKSDIQKWAETFHALGELPFGPEYNAALHKVTRVFSRRDVDSSRRNGSMLLQLRTNDGALTNDDPKVWQMREYVLGGTGDLVMDTMKQEPDAAFSGSERLARYLQANAASILAGKYSVPATFEGEPFLAGVSPMPEGFSWSAPGVDEAVVRKFALNTCNGCHKYETGNPVHAFHIKTRAVGVASPLSPFLAAEAAPNGPRVKDLTELLATETLKCKEFAGTH